VFDDNDRMTGVNEALENIDEPLHVGHV
jgi:hypothetical protein